MKQSGNAASCPVQGEGSSRSSVMSPSSKAGPATSNVTSSGVKSGQVKSGILLKSVVVATGCFCNIPSFSGQNGLHGGSLDRLKHQ